MPMTRKQWRRLGALVFLLMVIWLALMAADDRLATAVTAAVRDAGRIPFFAAMTLLPMVGFPVTPFYLLGGAVFGEWMCLAGTGISLLLNLLLCYAMAARWMRTGIEALLARRGRKSLPDFSRRHAWTYTLAIRLAPGPPLCVKNYLVALAGVPLTPYLAVSWPIAMGYAAGLIVIGDSLTGKRWLGVVLGLLLLAAFLALMAVARKRLRPRGARNRARYRPPASRSNEGRSQP